MFLFLISHLLDIFIIRFCLYSLITEKLTRYDLGDQYVFGNSPLLETMITLELDIDYACLLIPILWFPTIYPGAKFIGIFLNGLGLNARLLNFIGVFALHGRPITAVPIYRQRFVYFPRISHAPVHAPCFTVHRYIRRVRRGASRALPSLPRSLSHRIFNPPPRKDFQKLGTPRIFMHRKFQTSSSPL